MDALLSGSKRKFHSCGTARAKALASVSGSILRSASRWLQGVYMGTAIPRVTTVNLTTKLCHLILNYNYFKFSPHLTFRSMALPHIAPEYTNIFITDLEKCICWYHWKLLLYLRFMGDIFTVWTHRQAALEKFHQGFNNFHVTWISSWTTPVSRFTLWILLWQQNDELVSSIFYWKHNLSYTYIFPVLTQSIPHESFICICCFLQWLTVRLRPGFNLPLSHEVHWMPWD